MSGASGGGEFEKSCKPLRPHPRSALCALPARQFAHAVHPFARQFQELWACIAREWHQRPLVRMVVPGVKLYEPPRRALNSACVSVRVFFVYPRPALSKALECVCTPVQMSGPLRIIQGNDRGLKPCPEACCCTVCVPHLRSHFGSSNCGLLKPLAAPTPRPRVGPGRKFPPPFSRPARRRAGVSIPPQSGDSLAGKRPGRCRSTRRRPRRRWEDLGCARPGFIGCRTSGAGVPRRGHGRVSPACRGRISRARAANYPAELSR